MRDPRPRPTRHRRWPTRLAPRLLLAFSTVALVAVAVLAAAALVGTDRGLTAAQQSERQDLADRTAALVAAAYDAAGGWAEIDLTAASELAASGGARLVVPPGGASGEAGTGTGGGSGSGSGTAGGGAVSADVLVAGESVGAIRLVFGGQGGTAGRDVAWAWIGVATLVALLVAVAAAWWVSRRLSAPLVALAASARAFGAGDRSVRADTSGPGEVGEVARAFDDMADRVEASEEARRRMAADVAHELRTPLAVLQAGLEELRDGLLDPTPEVLAAMHDQSLRLGRVVADLGTLAGAEEPAADLHPVRTDLSSLVRGVLTAHEAAMAAAGLRATLSADDAVMASVDPDRFAQVIGNLLSNTERYCRPGDSVDVSVRRDAGTARVEVSDTGPGIPDDERPHVFERFWRGRDTAGLPGSGLGLPVVRALVQAHGGTVEVDVSDSGGTRVVVALPDASG